MLTIARLFGKSPFAPLQTHMSKVSACLDALEGIMQAYPTLGPEELQAKVDSLSHLEHEADVTKNDIRNHLPRSLYLPIDRAHFLEILSVQDSIADKAEEIGILLTLRPLEMVRSLYPSFLILFKKSVSVFEDAKQIVAEIDELLESSFGGIEAEKVKEMIEQAAQREHESSVLTHSLMKDLFSLDTSISPSSFTLWLKLVEEVGQIANLSERLANRIRMVLELK